MRDFTTNPHATFEDAVKAQGAQIEGQTTIDEMIDLECFRVDVRYALSILREYRPDGALAAALLDAEQALRRLLSALEGKS